MILKAYKVMNSIKVALQHVYHQRWLSPYSDFHRFVSDAFIKKNAKNELNKPLNSFHAQKFLRTHRWPPGLVVIDVSSAVPHAIIGSCAFFQSGMQDGTSDEPNTKRSFFRNSGVREIMQNVLGFNVIFHPSQREKKLKAPSVLLTDSNVTTRKMTLDFMTFSLLFWMFAVHWEYTYCQVDILQTFCGCFGDVFPIGQYISTALHHSVIFLFADLIKFVRLCNAIDHFPNPAHRVQTHRAWTGRNWCRPNAEMETSLTSMRRWTNSAPKLSSPQRLHIPLDGRTV